MIKLFDNSDTEIPFTSFKFPGGELSVKVPTIFVAKAVEIDAHIKSSEDLMELLMVTDAIRNLIFNIPIYLSMRYVPYARQDRVSVIGEAFSLKVFANIINSQKYSAITVWDAHSDVATALLNNCINYSQADLVIPFKNLLGNKENNILVSPDGGALKKIYQTAKALGIDKVIQATKSRDVNTGKITGTTVYSEHVGDKNFIIADDICDGGFTFIELAKRLKLLTTGKIILLVTHGIFSKGIEVFDGLIDEIVVLNNINDARSTDKTKVITVY